jgi:NAD(P)-dependent dehydrogenase (short-subunit alcohol dehydrogenase family)
LFTKELQERYGEDGIVSYSVDPGAVATELQRYWGVLEFIGKFLFKSPYEGAQTPLFAAFCDPKEVKPGSYLANCAVAKESNQAKDKKLQKELWDFSEKAVKL